MMRDAICGHCLASTRLDWAKDEKGQQAPYVVLPAKDDPFLDHKPRLYYGFSFLQCPICTKPTVWVRWSHGEADRQFLRVYPLRSDHPLPPRGVPDRLKNAYEEACRVAPVSANAAAALARRVLQLVLREIVPPGRNLDAEIEAARPQLPPFIVDALHSLRKIGNYALHPEKGEHVGEIVEASHQEAHLTIELVSALFQHVYAGRETAERLGAALDKRKLPAK